MTDSPVVLRRACVYRLYPTAPQAATLSQWVGACRFVYNLALEQRRDWHRPGRNLGFGRQCQEITALRAEVDWLMAVPVHALQQAVRDLDRAFRNFFDHRFGYPRPRKRGANDSFRLPDPAYLRVERVGRSSGRVRIPKLGWIRLRGWRPPHGGIASITISRRAGQWFAAVQRESQFDKPAPSQLPAVGIDRGIAVFAALSDGTAIAPVNHGKKAARALRRAQRNLSRKQRGSANRRKAKLRVARVHLRVANARKDFLHKHSTAIAKSHGVVVIEALKIGNMTRSAAGTTEAPGANIRQKAALNRSILDQGWGMFRTMLAYKLAERGGRLVEVPAAYTSQTCVECGVIDAASRNGQRFLCTACGHETHADTNAAINILRRADGSVLPVEASGCRASEAGTSRRAA